MSYRVELPVFSGPMDLLLHLVKQQEVDIHDVRIAIVLDQYLAHVDVLEALDLADLGDFVVMASTLMEIKSQELLPTEEIDLEQELNPKDDLIRRLLEYKRYRDISRRLAGMMERRGQMVEPVIAVPKELLNGDAEEKSFDRYFDSIATPAADKRPVILEGYAHLDPINASDNLAVPAIVDFINELRQRKLLETF